MAPKSPSIRVIEFPLRIEVQEEDRFRFWAAVPELDGRFLRVITLSDKLTITQCILGSEIPPMKLDYYPDTGSLYIDFSSRPSVESQVVFPGVVLDYDAEGTLVGIDIDHASRKLDLRELTTSHVPLAATPKP